MSDSTDSDYTYVPLRAPNIIGIVIFGVCVACHVALAIKFRRRWYAICLNIFTILELLGYIGRTISSKQPDAYSPFVMQIVCLTFAPAFFMAGIYNLLAQCVVVWGIGNSIVKPWNYSKVFIGLDILSIILQAGGGGYAGSANDDAGVQTGSHIMIGGLAFQVLCTFVFAVTCFVYYIKARKSFIRNKTSPEFVSALFLGHSKFARIRSARRTYVFLIGISIGVLLVFIRSVYRVIELAGGWTGYLMVHEVYFLVLDGLMVGIAAIISVVFYPAVCFGEIDITKESKEILQYQEQDNPWEMETGDILVKTNSIRDPLRPQYDA
ncbi:RTA1 like protein-domain-containing protein [Lipomyces japonicus]|uniref:RTA1 like protein-domain-containing protein n=1 Tax=Lipomyces japonicus TaxID=56871 RepID=UPI0034CF4C56